MSSNVTDFLVDPGCLIPHLEETKQQRGGQQPKNAIADSAYGSEENYAYLEREGITAYVRYNTFHQETKPRHKLNPFAAEQMLYDAAQDTFTCPNARSRKNAPRRLNLLFRQPPNPTFLRWYRIKSFLDKSY